MSTLDNIRARLPWSRADDPEGGSAVEPLPLEGVSRIRLPWLSRFSLPGLRAQVETNPVMALWLPATGEYIVGDQWRNRSDIAHIIEVSPRKGRAKLVEELIERSRVLGFRVLIISDDVWDGDRALYSRLGFQHSERIVFFRKELRDEPSPAPVERDPFTALDYQLTGPEGLQQLLRLDHASFPWLWWNSRREFEVYMAMEGVKIYIATQRSIPVGYFSFTMYEGWAHLDRIAVTHQRQGKGFGAAQLAYALERMVEFGAAYVALSTQENNTSSHRLYRRFGFTQTEDKMNFYELDLRQSK